jgi:hypothetical protein
MPELLQWIGERDLGQIEKHKYLGYALMNRNLSSIDEFADLMARHALHPIDFVAEGMMFEEQVNAIPLDTFSMVVKDEFTFPLLQIPNHLYASEIGQRFLAKGSEIVCMWWKEGEKYKLSFRSKPGVNIIPLAQKYGGNGHPQAAGALVETLPS